LNTQEGILYREGEREREKERKRENLRARSVKERRALLYIG
jgi:hypothetical protein